MNNIRPSKKNKNKNNILTPGAAPIGTERMYFNMMKYLYCQPFFFIFLTFFFFLLLQIYKIVEIRCASNKNIYKRRR